MPNRSYSTHQYFEKSFFSDAKFWNIKKTCPHGVRMELLAFNTRNEDEKTLLNAAGILRKEINDLNDTLPWPPSPDDLSVDKFKTPQLLETFLRTPLTGKFTETTSTQVDRLTLSYAQDFIYAVSRGRIKTPK